MTSTAQSLNNPGDTTEVDDIISPCERSDIIPIFPVRYALGQFDMELDSIAYPNISALMQNQGEPVDGLVTRLLRTGWVFVYTESAACYDAMKHPDAAPSYKGKWHIYHYSAPWEDGAHHPGKFVKYKWSGGSADKGQWKPYKNKSGDTVARDYLFVPATVSEISVAYSPCMWSRHFFAILEGSASKRGQHMQKVKTLPNAPEPNVSPLQLKDDGTRPTEIEMRDIDPNNLNFAPAYFVKELLEPATAASAKSNNPPAVHSSLDGPPSLNIPAIPANAQGTAAGPASDTEDLFLLSSTPLTLYTQSQIDQVRNTMIGKSEIGITIALHDPLGIAEDLGTLHHNIALEPLHEIISNTYAYTTFQALESKLGAVLEKTTHPFAISLQKNEIIIAEYNKKVDKQDNIERGIWLENNRLTRVNALEFARTARARAQKKVRQGMSTQEQEALDEAQKDIKTQRSESDKLIKAHKALRPEFHKTREQLSKATIKHNEHIQNLITLIEVWLAQSGPGSIKAYLALLTEETQTSIENDQIAALHHTLDALSQIHTGLQTSRQGRTLLSQSLFGKDGEDKESGVWTTHILPYTAKAADWSAKLIERYKGILDTRHGAAQAVTQLRTATDKFFHSISGTKTLADRLLKTGLYQSQAADPQKTLSTLQTLFKLDNVDFDISEQSVDKIIARVAGSSRAIETWDKSLLRKFYGKALDQKVPVITVDGKPIGFDHDLIVGRLNQTAGGIELALLFYSTVMTMDGLKAVAAEQSNAGALANYLRSNVAYNAATFADNFAKLLNRDIDKLISQNAGRVTRHLGYNTTVLSMQARRAMIKSLGKNATRAIRTFARVGPVIGAIDIVANTALAFDLYGSGDYDATAYAATGAVGGAAMLVVCFVSGPIGWGIAAVGILLSLISAIGLSSTKDSSLEKWVKTGFWGEAEYLYWDEVERTEIEASITIEQGQLETIKGFPAQLVIAKLISIGDGSTKAVLPNTTHKGVNSFMGKEMADFNNQNYMPMFWKEEGEFHVYLPGFTPGISVIALKHKVSSTSGSHRYGNVSTKIYSNELNFPGAGNAYWQTTEKAGVFTLALPPLEKTNWADRGDLLFTYHPNGQGGSNDIVVPSKYKNGTLNTEGTYEL